jgi:putative flippase GtrA
MRSPERAALPQFAVYLAGGVLSALVDVGGMQMLLLAGWPTMLAASAAFLAGLLVNFSFHARLTFGKTMNQASFARYLCLVGCNYLVTLACVGATDALWRQPMIGKIASLPVVAVIGFLVGKRWVFR